MDCFKREAYEEGYVSGACQLLGAITVDHHDNPNFDPNGKYPIVGYQVFYRMDIEKIYPFEAGYEASRRTFIDHHDVADYYPKWHELYQAVMDEALKVK
ncbi:hypothetical protein [Alkalibacillus haloalkaliphilus]|uniref:hypothetical protein n=1 Tax=Alkalibacillus haloalkaliphilus TaxID=94136 RepID=UPI0002F4A8B7